MYYQESKKINIVGFLIAYVVSIIIAIILGYIYSVIILINPITLINLFIVFGLGLTLGIFNRFIVRLTHNRYKKSQIVQAFIIGLLVIIFRWINHILYFSTGEISDFIDYLINLPLIFKPNLIFQKIQLINNSGYEFYTFPGGSVLGAFNINGFSLTIIWILELILILTMSIVAIYKTKIYPYSEKIGKWYPKYTLFKDFESISTVNQLLKNLQKDSFVTIQALGKGNGLRHSKIHVFYHKNENRQYLTIEKIYIERQGKKNSNILINNFSIDNKTAELILENFEYKKEKTEMF